MKLKYFISQICKRFTLLLCFYFLQEFEDLDEIIARHIQPMAATVRDIMGHRYFRDCEGKREVLDKVLTDDKKKNPSKYEHQCLFICLSYFVYLYLFYLAYLCLSQYMFILLCLSVFILPCLFVFVLLNLCLSYFLYLCLSYFVYLCLSQSMFILLCLSLFIFVYLYLSYIVSCRYICTSVISITVLALKTLVSLTLIFLWKGLSSRYYCSSTRLLE